MKLNAASYFAGIGTVAAALAVGFGGAMMITGSSPKIESRNRVQQVMAHAPVSPSQAAEVEKPTEIIATITSPSTSVPVVSTQSPEPASPAIVAKPVEVPTAVKSVETVGAATQDTQRANRIRLREADITRAVERENQRKWMERKRRQEEIDAATVAVRRMLRDNGVRQVVQVENSRPTRLGFFGEGN